MEENAVEKFSNKTCKFILLVISTLCVLFVVAGALSLVGARCTTMVIVLLITVVVSVWFYLKYK
jgi:hypothetical protein